MRITTKSITPPHSEDLDATIKNCAEVGSGYISGCYLWDALVFTAAVFDSERICHRRSYTDLGVLNFFLEFPTYEDFEGWLWEVVGLGSGGDGGGGGGGGLVSLNMLAPRSSQVAKKNHTKLHKVPMPTAENLERFPLANPFRGMLHTLMLKDLAPTTAHDHL